MENDPAYKVQRRVHANRWKANPYVTAIDKAFSSGYEAALPLYPAWLVRSDVPALAGSVRTWVCKDDDPQSGDGRGR